MKYDLVIFDLDGTLLNTLDDLKNSVNYALKENGLPTRTLREVRSFVGNGIRNLMTRIVPDGTKERVVDKVHQTFIKHYSLHKADLTAPYPRMLELLQKLHYKGIKIAVLSNKDDDAVKALSERYLCSTPHFTLGRREEIAQKPAPDGVYEIMKKLNVKDKNRVILVGDSEVDILTANNADVHSLTVLWGFRDQKEMMGVGKTKFINTVPELLKAIIEN